MSRACSPSLVVPRGLRALLCATLACVLLPAQGRASARQESERRLSAGYQAAQLRVGALLQQATGERAPAESELVGELGRIGGEALDPMFDCLVDGRVPDDSFEEWKRLSSTQESILRRALLASGERRLVDLVERTVLDSADDPRREAAVGLLGDLGRAKHLPLLFECAWRPETRDEGSVVSPRVFEAALEDIIHRDAETFSHLRHAVLRAPRPLVERVVRSVAASGDEAGLGFLGQLLGFDDSLDGRLLSSMGRLAPAASVEAAGAASAAVRGYLDEQRPTLCQAAALAVGRLRDESSIPALIELLGAEQQGVRLNALWALRKITGLSLPEDPQRWQAWYTEELDWFTRQSPAVFDRLGSQQKSEVVAAIYELGRRRLFRVERAQQVLAVLQHGDPSLRVLGVKVLEQIASPVAAPELSLALEDPNANVRAAAAHALRAITGRDALPVLQG